MPPPLQLASPLVQLEHGASSLGVEVIAIDQGRGNVSEVRELGLILGREVNFPKLCARLCIQADEHILHATDVEPAVVVGRRGPDPAAIGGSEKRNLHRPFPLGLPKLFPGFPVEAANHLKLAVLGLGHEDLVASHNRAGVTGVNFHPPTPFQILQIRLARQDVGLQHARPIGTAPLGPIGVHRSRLSGRGLSCGFLGQARQGRRVSPSPYGGQ